MTAKMIKTEAPKKGDLVVGHEVYAFIGQGLPAVPGKIVAVSASGHSVTLEISKFLAVLGGSKQRWEWTWRASVAAYQPKGSTTKRGVGLALIR